MRHQNLLGQLLVHGMVREAAAIDRVRSASTAGGLLPRLPESEAEQRDRLAATLTPDLPARIA